MAPAIKKRHTRQKTTKRTAQTDVKWPTFKKAYLKSAQQKFRDDPGMLELLKSIHQGRDFK